MTQTPPINDGPSPISSCFWLRAERPAPTLGLALGLLAALAGCAPSLRDVDARIDRVMAERSGLLGEEARNPFRTAAQPGSVLRGDAVERARSLTNEPASTNPASSALTFAPADEARNVAERLDAYATRALGISYAIDDKPDPTPAGIEIRTLSLADCFKLSQTSAREYLSAEEDFMLASIRLLQERRRWDFRFFNDTTASISGQGDDGDFQSALNVINTLRSTRRLPFGGEVEARWVTRATDQLRRQVSGGYRQSSELVLDGRIPLLAGAGPTAREDLIQSERDLVYAARTFERFRRSFLVDIADDYFRLIESRQQIVNQRRQLDSLLRLNEGERARVAAGRRAAFNQRITENQVFTARSRLVSLIESYVLQLDRFKIRLGMSPDTVLDVAPVQFEVPEPEIAEGEATRQALDYRLDLQNRRDQVDDARRAIRNAENALLPRLDLNGDVGVPTDPDQATGGVNFSGDDLNYSAGVTLSLPLDRRIERLSVRAAQIQLERRLRDFEQSRDTVVVNVRAALRNIDQARFQLQLAEEQVKINQSRLREQNLKSDEIDPQDILDSETELLRAENARDQARTGLRLSVLNYLLESDQLRVARDGSFQPLPGMKFSEQSDSVTPPALPPNALPGQPAAPPEPQQPPAPPPGAGG
jgi:outer membrane protein TolC